MDKNLASAMVMCAVVCFMTTRTFCQCTATAIAQTGTTNCSGYPHWYPPGNITANDNQYASVTPGSTNISDCLNATHFGFAIPADAVITGISVNIERHYSKNGGNTGITDHLVQLLNNYGALFGFGYQANSVWPENDGTKTYGGNNNVWGVDLTPSIVNSNAFGVRLQVKNASTGTPYPTAFVDYISMTVYYTWPAPTITAGGPVAFCPGGSVQLTSSASSGNQWYKDGVIISGETGQTYSATSGGSYTVVRSENGCSSAASAPVIVTVNPPPTTSGITICQGGSGTLTSTLCNDISGLSQKYAGSGVNIGTNKQWLNPQQIISDNTCYAYYYETGLGNFTAEYYSAILTAANFGFSIPSNAIILGLKATIGRYASKVGPNYLYNCVRDHSVQLIKAGTATGSNLALTSLLWPESETSQEYGFLTSNVWGTSLTPSDINNSGFGLGVGVYVTVYGAGNIVYGFVDYIQIEVSYTIPGSLDWFTASSGGTLIGSGSPFNPVGVAGSPLQNTNTPGTYTFYAQCSPVSDCRTATDFVIQAQPTAIPGGPDAVCQSSSPSPITLTGAGIGEGATTGAWSVTGLDPANGGVNGTLSSTEPTSDPGSVTYTPPAGYAGTITLTLTTNDPEGPCGPASGDRMITVDPPPTASAGGSTTICSNATATVSGASAANGTILWTTGNGGGTIDNPTTLTPTYHAVASDQGKAILLTMTVTGTACAPATATAFYTVNVSENTSGHMTAGEASSTPTLCMNTALSPDITLTTTGATGIGTPTGLPNGVNAAWASDLITISGTPLQSGTFSYSIPLTGWCENVFATGTITVNPLPVITTSSTNVTCFGAGDGEITITVTGGLSPYYFSIDNGGTYTSLSYPSPYTITGLGPGTYNVRVKDSNNCVSGE